MDSIFFLLQPEHTFSFTLGGKPVSSEVMEVTLSCDAAKVSNTEMGKVMQVLHKYLEHPHEMLTI